MIKREYLEKMRNDEELQVLRRKVYEITGSLNEISFCLGRDSIESFKERLKKIVEEHDATGQK